MRTAIASRIAKAGVAAPPAAGLLWIFGKTGTWANRPSEFMPHGYCYLWDPWIVWLHVISDGLITLSYYAIPVILIYFIRKNKDLPFNAIFWMFGGFILACGTTHFMEIWNVWHGNYMLAGMVKAGTAALSVVAAVTLISLAPKAVSLPGLQVVNRRLEEQMAEREQAGMAREQVLKDLATQLEAANNELEAFTYSVSHDLRAPLRHIGGFSRILIEDFGPTMNAEARHYLQRIEEGTHRMGLLVDELLNLARVGRHTVNLQVTSLNTLIEEVVSLLQPEAEGRAVTWKISSLPPVNCDPVLIKQVFQNLIANALKFTRPRGRAVIEISHREKNGQIVIEVRDNGVGFNMKYMDKLFGVFQRLHRAEEFEGTGIGLATAHRILHKHGERIWAEAELNEGAAFFFTLAVANATLTAGEVENKNAIVGAQS